MLDAWTSNNEAVLKTVDQLGTCLKGIFHFCSWYSDLLCSIETLNVWIPLYCAPCPLGSQRSIPIIHRGRFVSRKGLTNLHIMTHQREPDGIS